MDDKIGIDNKNKISIFQKYSTKAITYSKDHESRYFWFHQAYDNCLEIMSKNEFEYVVDFGCGSGKLIIELAKKFPNIHFIGIDFSNELIAIAKEITNLENLTFYVQDFCTIDNSEWFCALKKKSIFYILSGSLAYYNSKDIFPILLKSIWQISEKSVIYFTFHNSKFFLRKWFFSNEKKYWHAKDAINFFNGNKFTIRYFCFFSFDLILSKSSVCHKFLFFLDNIIAKLPNNIAMYLFMNFELVIFNN